MKRIHFVLMVFVLFQLADVLLTGYGITVNGIGFEKNVLMKNIIIVYGFVFVSVIKMLISSLIVIGIILMFNRFEKKRKYLFYLSIFVSFIPLYGILSSLYVLLYIHKCKLLCLYG